MGLASWCKRYVFDHDHKGTGRSLFTFIVLSLWFIFLAALSTSFVFQYASRLTSDQGEQLAALVVLSGGSVIIAVGSVVSAAVCSMCSALIARSLLRARRSRR